MPDTDVLTSPHVLEYPYSRSVGPVLGQFLAGLRDGRILGSVCGSGGDRRVVVPPAEYDPVTGKDAGELVEVGPGGEVVSWCFVHEPREGDLLGRPHAWALVRPDGADTAMLHVLDVASPDQVSTGMRVRASFRPASERVGSINDIECFVPAGAPDASAGGTPGAGAESEALAQEAATGPVETLATPIRLDYSYTAGIAQSRFLKGMLEGVFVGQRCPRCKKVYVPPRGSCPTDGVPTTEDVELPDTGTVTTFCVVNVPFHGQAIELPYVCAQVLLDGANISFMHLIQGIPADQVRMGLRVRAVWASEGERKPSLESVKHFEPTGEPDAPYETYEEYL